MKNRNVDKSRNIDKNQSIDSDFKDNTTFISDKHSNYELFPKMRLRRLRKNCCYKRTLPRDTFISKRLCYAYICSRRDKQKSGNRINARNI